MREGHAKRPRRARGGQGGAGGCHSPAPAKMQRHSSILVATIEAREEEGGARGPEQEDEPEEEDTGHVLDLDQPVA